MVSSLPDSYVTANVSHRQPRKSNRKPALYNKCAQILLALRILVMQMIPQYFMIPWPKLQLMQRDQNQYFSKQKDMKNWSFQLWLMRGNTLFAILKRRNLLKD